MVTVGLFQNKVNPGFAAFIAHHEVNNIAAAFFIHGVDATIKERGIIFFAVVNAQKVSVFPLQTH